MATTNQEPGSVLLLKSRGYCKTETAKEQILSLAVVELIFCGLDIFVSSKIIDVKGAPKTNYVVRQ